MVSITIASTASTAITTTASRFPSHRTSAKKLGKANSTTLAPDSQPAHGGGSTCVTKNADVDTKTAKPNMIAVFLKLNIYNTL